MRRFARGRCNEKKRLHENRDRDMEEIGIEGDGKERRVWHSFEESARKGGGRKRGTQAINPF